MAEDWEIAPQPPALTQDAVHLWRFTLDRPAEERQGLLAHLSPDEIIRAARFRHARDADRFSAGRGLLRTILASYLATSPAALRFAYSPGGKPHLADHPTLAFNLAHSDDRALLAVTRQRTLGCDLEAIRAADDMAAVARHFFAPAEFAAWSALPIADQTTGFYHCWTRKEALLKAWGDGLSRDLASFVVSLHPNAPATLIQVQGESPTYCTRWQLRDLTPWPNYQATLAIEALEALTLHLLRPTAFD